MLESGPLKLCPEIEQDFNWNINDIPKLHPILVLKILEKFGFRKYKELDNTKRMELWKIESVNHWLEYYASKQYSSNEFVKITTDYVHILHYFESLVQFINNNHSILNKDI